MPSLPNRITIDRAQHKVLIDGQEFPWFIEEGGPTIDGIDNANAAPVVWLPVLTKDIEVIPVVWPVPAEDENLEVIPTNS